jgi:hypothetical protein
LHSFTDLADYKRHIFWFHTEMMRGIACGVNPTECREVHNIVRPGDYEVHCQAATPAHGETYASQSEKARKKYAKELRANRAGYSTRLVLNPQFLVSRIPCPVDWPANTEPLVGEPVDTNDYWPTEQAARAESVRLELPLNQSHNRWTIADQRHLPADPKVHAPKSAEKATQ